MPYLADKINRSKKLQKCRDLIVKICDLYDVTVDQMMGPSNAQEIEARQACAYACRELGLTQQHTADELGLLDHGSVAHCKKRIQMYIRNYPEAYSQLIALIKSNQ